MPLAARTADPTSLVPRAARRAAALSWLTVAILACGVATAAAHAFSVSYAWWKVEGAAIETVLHVPLDDLDLLLHLDRDVDGTVSDAELAQAQTALGDYLGRHVHVDADDAPVALTLNRVGRWRDSAGAPYLEMNLAATAASPIRAITVRSDLLSELYPDHRTLGDLRLGGRHEEFVFGPGRVYQGRLAAAALWRTAAAFLRLGIEHILTGYDHMLFLVGLLLASTSLRQLVTIITAFTIAHSITLALATLGMVSPVPWMVEAAIALSIAYIGFENLFLREPRYRWGLTFAFGLVHGFGFAAVLREMQLPPSSVAISLASFNVGVEIGQLGIVCLIYPLIDALSRTSYRVAVVRTASGAIAAAGIIWFVQRLP